MIPLEGALLNLGDRILELIGDDHYRLLKAMGKDTSDQGDLVRLCINIHTEWGLLRKKELRNLIFNSLNMEDARELALILGLSYDKSPYKVLREKTVRKNTRQEEYLFGFFGLSPPEEKIEDDPKETTELVVAKYGLFPHQRNALVDTEQILDYE